MREFPLSNSEQTTILDAACSNLRLDCRRPLDFRNIRVYFPSGESGCCQVRLGSTLVMSTVTCEVGEPRSQRPNEGVFHVNLELSPMASASFEGGRLDKDGARMQMLLENCLRDAHCLDRESLCIVSGEKVFIVRVSVAVLNHEGNILDCAVLSAVIALAHFRRPDVSVVGDSVRVHPASERPPVPLLLRHFPLTMSLALLAGGKVAVLDPSRKEEEVMDGLVVVSMNIHKELCGLQTIGGMLLEPDQILRCIRIAKRRIRGLTAVVHRSLANAASGKHLGDDPELFFDLSASAGELERQRKEQKREEAGLSEGELSDASEEEPMDTEEAAVNGAVKPGDANTEGPRDIYSSAVVSTWTAPATEADVTAVGGDAVRRKGKTRQKRRHDPVVMREEEEEEEEVKLLCL